MLDVVLDSVKRTPRRKLYLAVFVGVCCIWALAWLRLSGGRLDCGLLSWPSSSMERHQAVDLLSVSLDEIHPHILHAHTEYLCLDALQVCRGFGTRRVCDGSGHGGKLNRLCRCAGGVGWG